MIYLTGDLHGPIDIFKLGSEAWPEGQSLAKKDYLIVLGDFGCIWHGDERDNVELDFLKNSPWTTLFVDGNHENFDVIEELEVVNMFGDKVGKVNDSIFHLRRGIVYNIDGNLCFTLGGALSIDKHCRKEGESWWPRELITPQQLDRAWQNLLDVGMEVDFVLTHAAPLQILANYGIIGHGWNRNPKLDDPTAYQLQDISDALQFKHWYHGHYHTDMDVIRCSKHYTCLYDGIIQLGKWVNQ